MNNVTPFRGQQMMQPSSPWCWDGTRWVMNPAWSDDQCGCGPPSCQQPQPPSCFSAVAKADACWDQSQALYNLVSKVVSDIFTKNPGIIPSPPPSSGSSPLMGVTDGSDAAPGQVGEFMTVSPTFNYAAGTGTVTTVSTLVVPPGDWDLWASLVTSTAINGAQIGLSPVPPGVSNNMSGFLGLGTITEVVEIIGQAARGSFKVPTLLAFSASVTDTTGSVAGIGTLTVSARRRR